MCTFPMFSSEVGEQYPHKWSNTQYNTIKSIGLQNLIKVYHFKIDQVVRGAGQSTLRWSWWEIKTNFIYIYEDVNDTSWIAASIWWAKQGVHFFRYVTNQKMGKVPKPISAPECDTPVTVRRRGNVLSGAANRRG